MCKGRRNKAHNYMYLYGICIGFAVFYRKQSTLRLLRGWQYSKDQYKYVHVYVPIICMIASMFFNIWHTLNFWKSGRITWNLSCHADCAVCSINNFVIRWTTMAGLCVDYCHDNIYEYKNKWFLSDVNSSVIMIYATLFRPKWILLTRLCI